MAKLTRQQQQIFAGQAPSDMIAAFGTPQTGTPVYSTNLSTLQTTTYQQGWQNAIIADKAPFLEDMNGVQYGFSYQIAYNQQMGIPEWLNTQDYYTNSRAMGSDGNIYRSLTDDNVGNNPILDDGTNWVLDNAAVTDVLNYLTNCVISAPNGVASYSGTTVTVPELTNFLFPDGRNADNTLKSVNFSLASAASGTITGSVSSDYNVYVTSELELDFIPVANYYVTDTQPASLNVTTLDAVWYNPTTNILSFAGATTSTPSWSAFEGALCATLTYDGSAMTAFNPIYPVGLANVDLSNCTKPYITETYVNGTSGYITYSNGLHEEWGKRDVNTAFNTFSLIKPYINTDYSVFTTIKADETGISENEATAQVYGLTTSSFNVMCSTIRNSGSAFKAEDIEAVYWRTIGYIS